MAQYTWPENGVFWYVTCCVDACKNVRQTLLDRFGVPVPHQLLRAGLLHHTLHKDREVRSSRWSINETVSLWLVWEKISATRNTTEQLGAGLFSIHPFIHSSIFYNSLCFSCRGSKISHKCQQKPLKIDYLCGFYPPLSQRNKYCSRRTNQLSWVPFGVTPTPFWLGFQILSKTIIIFPHIRYIQDQDWILIITLLLNTLFVKSLYNNNFLWIIIVIIIIIVFS